MKKKTTVLSNEVAKACYDAIKAGLPISGSLHNSTPEHVMEQISEAFKDGRGFGFRTSSKEESEECERLMQMVNR